MLDFLERGKEIVNAIDNFRPTYIVILQGINDGIK